MTEQFNVIAEQEHTTMMAYYDALPRENKSYQSETALLKSWKSTRHPSKISKNNSPYVKSNLNIQEQTSNL